VAKNPPDLRSAGLGIYLTGLVPNSKLGSAAVTIREFQRVAGSFAVQVGNSVLRTFPSAQAPDNG